MEFTDEQLEELRLIARTYNEKGFPKYAREFFARALLSASKPAAPTDDVRQLNEGYRRGITDAFHRVNVINASRQGKTADETCACIVRTLAEWVNNGAAPAAPAQSGEPVLPAWFDAFLTNVCEIPDRNSPDDEPEAIVATLEELKSCALNAIECAAPQPQPTSAVAMDDGDSVLVERSLLGAACAAISKKRNAPNVLEKLREITLAKPASSAVAMDEREAFETWITEAEIGALDFGRDGECYVDWDVQVAWRGWKARAASQQATATQPEQAQRALTIHDLRNIEGRLNGSGYVGTMGEIRALLTAAQQASGDKS